MLENFSGRTRVYFEIGDPIEQVKAPNLMTRHFHEHGHDVIVVPIRVPSPNVGAFLKAAADCPNVDGIVVTVPHKMESSKHCGTLTASAALLGCSTGWDTWTEWCGVAPSWPVPGRCWSGRAAQAVRSPWRCWMRGSRNSLSMIRTHNA